MNVENDKNYEFVREVYDRIMSDRFKRRRDKMAVVQAELATAEREDLEELAKTLHNAYTAGSTKKSLRHATRQYGSPKFNELWDAVPFTKGPGSITRGSYYRTEDTATFTRESWDWSGIDDAQETLEYSVQQASGRNVLLSSTLMHMTFLRNNLTEIEKVLNNE